MDAHLTTTLLVVPCVKLTKVHKGMSNLEQLQRISQPVGLRHESAAQLVLAIAQEHYTSQGCGTLTKLATSCLCVVLRVATVGIMRSSSTHHT